MKKILIAPAVVFFLTVQNPAAAQAQNSSAVETSSGVKAKPDLGSKTEQELRKIMQEIGDAFLYGNKAVLECYLAPDFTHTNSTGKVQTKAEIVKNLQASPANIHPSYAFEEMKVQDYGNTAVLNAIVKETSDANGGRLTTADRFTYVFIRQNGQWQVVVGHTSVIPADRTVAKVDPAIYDAYAGQYSLAPDQILTLAHEGDKLTGRVTGWEPGFEFLPENETTFFMQGRQDQMTFVKDDKGQVTHISHRLPDGQVMIEKKIK